MFKINEQLSKEEKEKIIIRKAKALNISGYQHGLQEYEKAVEEVNKIQSNPDGKSGKEIFEAKINMALSKAKLETFEKLYKEDFGEDLPKL